MGPRRQTDTSMETILNFDNRDAQSQWSVIWSTTNIPGMDNAAGDARFRVKGRRRLRLGSLTLSALFTMHCHVSSAALTSGFLVFILFLVVAVMALANPLRHFEVYLGQWSINGPGRAFRIVPLLDGIGVAVCLNAIFRAINYSVLAALAGTYVIHSINDADLPFTYCRDFGLKSYKPTIMDVKYRSLKNSVKFVLRNSDLDQQNLNAVGFLDLRSRNTSGKYKSKNKYNIRVARTKVCNETYPRPYPPIYTAPAYNFLYVEVGHLRPDFSFTKFNLRLMLVLIGIWFFLWMGMVSERLQYNRIIWNNMPIWITVIPWIWVLFLVFITASNIYLFSSLKSLTGIFSTGTKDIMAGITDAFEVALYIHSAGVGTEIITGKGLNRYASGHIDPLLNNENVMHSVLVLILTILHSSGAAMCALVDDRDPNVTSSNYDVRESTVWIFAMYSKCTTMNGYSHFTSTLIFLGFTFSYATVAFVLLKTALHVIFEYRLKFVFIEQIVVAVFIIICGTLSMIYTTNGGLALLETVDTMLTTMATPLICLLELVALLYVYGSNDFESDVNLAMEDNPCSSRMTIQWQTMPIITIGMLVLKVTILLDSDMPSKFMLLALIPLMCIILAIPLRAFFNMYKFLRPRRAERN